MAVAAFVAPFAAHAVAVEAPKPVESESVDLIAEDPSGEDAVPADPVVEEPVIDHQKVAEAAAAAKATEEARLAFTAQEKAEEERKEEAKLATRRISTRVFRLEHANAEEVAERFNATWSGDFGVTWKVSKIAQAFPEANAVMVTAPALILDACAEAIRQIDVEVPQVYIEARFVELSNNASHKLGIDWQMLDGMGGTIKLGGGIQHSRLGSAVTDYSRVQSDGKTTTSYGLSGGKGADGDITYFNGTLDFTEMTMVLRALESSEDARTFSNPKIIVSSGKKAIVDMTQKYPNVKISAKRTTSGGGADSLDLDMQMAAIPGEDKFMFAKEAFFSWGIQLEVTPRVGTNGLINVMIVPTISDCSEYVTAGTEGDTSGSTGTYSAKYPVINVQRLVTEFNLASETTAVIGGLSRTIERQVDNGIPWLRDWPWIGPLLFGSKVRVKEQREIIVFVTVGLIDPNALKRDAGLPKNAVLGRQYVEGLKLEPGDKPRKNMEGIESLDLRPLSEQALDPLATNTVERMSFIDRYMPFSRDPSYKPQKETR